VSQMENPQFRQREGWFNGAAGGIARLAAFSSKTSGKRSPPTRLAHQATNEELHLQFWIKRLPNPELPSERQKDKENAVDMRKDARLRGFTTKTML
jgi:hypothetical protein